MPIILDTNVISEVISSEPDLAVDAWFSEQDEADIYLTTITEAELLFGPELMAIGLERDAYIAAMERILSIHFADRILPFDRAAARAYPQVRAAREATRRGIDDADCFIAAIAHSFNAAVATRNVRDFRGYPIEVINPWEHSS